MLPCLKRLIELLCGSRHQCWAKFVAPIGNFPASHEPNRNLKILAGHVPTNENDNRNMLNFFFGRITKKKSNAIPNQINHKILEPKTKDIYLPKKNLTL